ncbi:MAG: hypothetical protein U1E40_05250 [Amaricoccus sp.]
MAYLVQQRDLAPAAELVADVFDPVALEARLADARSRRARALAGKTAAPPMPSIGAKEASPSRSRFLAGLAVGSAATAVVAAALLQAGVLSAPSPGPAPSAAFAAGRLEAGTPAPPPPAAWATPVPVTIEAMPTLSPPAAEVAVRTDALWPASRTRSGVPAAMLAEAPVPDAGGQAGAAPSPTAAMASAPRFGVAAREHPRSRLGAVDGPAPTAVTRPAPASTHAPGARPGAAARTPAAPAKPGAAAPTAPRSGPTASRPAASQPATRSGNPGRPGATGPGGHGPTATGKGPGGPGNGPGRGGVAAGRGGHAASAGPSASRGPSGGPGHSEGRGGSGRGGGGKESGRGHR